MKLGYSLFFILYLFAIKSLAVEDLPAFRKTLTESVMDSKVAQSFYERVYAVENNGKPIFIGYQGMAELVLCKHAFSPIAKLTHFNKGKKLLEKSISLEPNNAELRFYRYCTQLNAPPMLNYYSNLGEDKQFLFNFIEAESKNQKKDLDLYVRIKTFLLTNKSATQADKEILKSL